MSFTLGWLLGTAAMWAYFKLAGLIRSRDEYYESRRRKLLEEANR